MDACLAQPTRVLALSVGVPRAHALSQAHGAGSWVPSGAAGTRTGVALQGEDFSQSPGTMPSCCKDSCARDGRFVIMQICVKELMSILGQATPARGEDSAPPRGSTNPRRASCPASFLRSHPKTTTSPALRPMRCSSAVHRTSPQPMAVQRSLSVPPPHAGPANRRPEPSLASGLHVPAGRGAARAHFRRSDGGAAGSAFGLR